MSLTKNNILPIRYPKKEIDLNIFKSLFDKLPKYPGKESTIKEIGPVWEKCFRNWTLSTTDVFQCIENKNLQGLKEIYENYYIDGISDGASSGRAFEKEGNGDEYKLNKSKRNIERAHILSNYLDLGNNIDEIYNTLFNTINIPVTPNYGQSWGWWNGDNFIHFELIDYIYFLHHISQILDEYNLTKTCFLGDGSGLLSSLVYENHKISSSTHIDLSHFLIKQYLNNHKKSYIKYYYAEEFDYETIHDSQILINQDSFPEMSDKSVEKYIKNIKHNNVPFILSYNKEVIFEGGNPHSDFKSIFSKYGYKSIFRTNTIMRPGYVIELFHLN